MIADVFYRRGIIERWGRGTLKMAELAAAAGLPQPEIEDDGGCVMVRFRRASFGTPTPLPLRVALSLGSPVAFSLNVQQRDILDLLRHSDQPLALREIRASLPASVSVRQVKRALARLRELGLVTATGHGVSARWKLGSE